MPDDSPQLIAMSEQLGRIASRLDNIEEELHAGKKVQQEVKDSLTKIERRLEKEDIIAEANREKRERVEAMPAKVEHIEAEVARLSDIAKAGGGGLTVAGETVNIDQPHTHWIVKLVESENGRRVIWWVLVAFVLAAIALAGNLTLQELSRAWPGAQEAPAAARPPAEPVSPLRHEFSPPASLPGDAPAP